MSIEEELKRMRKLIPPDDYDDCREFTKEIDTLLDAWKERYEFEQLYSLILTNLFFNIFTRTSDEDVIFKIITNSLNIAAKARDRMERDES